MSYGEVLDAATGLAEAEKLQLLEAVSSQLGLALPPSVYFKNGDAIQTGGLVTTDAEGMRILLEAAGMTKK